MYNRSARCRKEDMKLFDSCGLVLIYVENSLRISIRFSHMHENATFLCLESEKKMAFCNQRVAKHVVSDGDKILVLKY